MNTTQTQIKNKLKQNITHTSKQKHLKHNKHANKLTITFNEKQNNA